MSDQPKTTDEDVAEHAQESAAQAAEGIGAQTEGTAAQPEEKPAEDPAAQEQPAVEEKPAEEGGPRTGAEVSAELERMRAEKDATVDNPDITRNYDVASHSLSADSYIASADFSSHRADAMRYAAADDCAKRSEDPWDTPGLLYSCPVHGKVADVLCLGPSRRIFCAACVEDFLERHSCEVLSPPAPAETAATIEETVDLGASADVAARVGHEPDGSGGV